LANLAKKYFTSHGPATIQDFSWWSGLTVSDSKRALEIIMPDFISITIENQTFWFSPITTNAYRKNLVFLLPAFDEFVISYKNRTPSISIEHQSVAFSSNGIFRPIIVINGQVVGLWKKTIKKDKLLLGTNIIHLKANVSKNSILKAAKPLGNFLSKQVELIH
jgi:hypothetical protein